MFVDILKRYGKITHMFTRPIKSVTWLCTVTSRNQSTQRVCYNHCVACLTVVVFKKAIYTIASVAKHHTTSHQTIASGNMKAVKNIIQDGIRAKEKIDKRKHQEVMVQLQPATALTPTKRQKYEPMPTNDKYAELVYLCSSEEKRAPRCEAGSTRYVLCAYMRI